MYSHKGWKPALDYVTGEATYVATYDSSKVEYKVTFMNGVDVIDEQMVPYGEAAVAPTDVTRDGYKFTGWNTSFSKVTENLTVKALFEELPKSSSSVASSSSIAKSCSSSKIVSSSSVAKVSSSSKAKSSSSSVKSSSSKKTDAISVTEVPQFSMLVQGRLVQVSNARVGSAYAFFDMQGRVLQKGRVEFANYSIVVPRAGSFFVRIDDQIKKVNVR